MCGFVRYIYDVVLLNVELYQLLNNCTHQSDVQTEHTVATVMVQCTSTLSIHACLQIGNGIPKIFAQICGQPWLFK